MTSMMAFITRYWRSRRNNILRSLCLALAICCLPASALAGGISVERAELRLTGSNYQPSANLTITLNPVVEQALTHGVPLYFVSEFTLVHERWYWLNDVAAHDEQVIRLSFNALTRQYRLNHGTLFQNFSSLDDALLSLGHLAFNQFPAQALKPGVSYVASARMHLDLNQLPKPLQINALVNTDWEMDSGWHQWTLTGSPAPAEPAPDAAPPAEIDAPPLPEAQ
jgi:hypothetical protein